AHGGVKVTDFGLAAGGAAHHVADGPVAQTTMAGTPLYMSPEQARGEAIDLRSDIYALGATLYHVVSGKPPFQAATVDELVSLHRTANRPQLAKKGHTRTSVAAIDSLVARMMAPDPKHRFASYDELLRALELASVRHTRPAGIFVRSIATFIDLMIVTIVLTLAGALLTGNGGIAMPFVLPFLIALQTFALAARGTTPGKALFELEVVSIATGRKPRLYVAFIRSFLVLAAPLIADGALSYSELASATNLVTSVLKIATAVA